jgi:thermitase
MRLPTGWLPLLTAALVATQASGATARRSDSPVARRLASPAPAGLTVVDVSDRLAAERLRREIGSDWSDVLLTVDPADLSGLLARHGGVLRARGLGRTLVKPPSRIDPFSWYLQVQADPVVGSVQPNYQARHAGCRQMSVDILESGSRTDLGSQPALVMVRADSVRPATGVTVAIVDSGVAAIPELAGRLLEPIEVRSDSDDGEEAGGSDADSVGHGTAMASLVAWLAPEASILPVNVVRPDCRTTAFDMAQGIRLAAEAGAQVISVSLGTSRPSPIVDDAVAEAVARGALVVAAGGNAGVIEAPARSPGALAVTAVDDDGWPPAFAPQGSRIDVAAPGVGVRALGPQSTLTMTGTSPSTALVAAAAARIFAIAPGATPAEVRAAVQSSVTPASDIGWTLEGRIGTGVLDYGRLP